MRHLDNPIQTRVEDLLERTDHATKLALDIQNQPGARDSGFVVAVMGPWGCGKTSLLNLTCEQLHRDKIPTIRFNPWIFSGTEKLVSHFFLEIESQLREHKRLRKLANTIAGYGQALEAVSPKFRILRLLKCRSPLERGTYHYQCRIKATLRGQDTPVVVVVDDIDRLSSPEIHEIFRLVRLTASFPNLIYVLAFDRKVVEHALTKGGIVGSEYLDKIVQIPIDVPSISSELLRKCIIKSIDHDLPSSQLGADFDQHRLLDIFCDIIQPLIGNIRDLRRYICSTAWTLNRLNGRVQLADVLALEAIRLFMPAVFSQLQSSVELLTSIGNEPPNPNEFNGESKPDRFASLKQLIADADYGRDGRKNVIESIIYRLFPAISHEVIGRSSVVCNESATWIRHGLVASEPILRLYLENFESSELRSHADAGRILKLNDAQSITKFLHSLQPHQRRDAIVGLSTYDGPFRVEWIQSLIIALYRLVPTIPSQSISIFERKSYMIVNSVVCKVLKSKSVGSVLTLIEEILPNLDTLSSKMWLILQIGHREGVGHKLISADEAERLESHWLLEYNNINPSQFASEWDLLRVLSLASSMSKDRGEEFSIAESPEVTLAILRSAKDEVVSQQFDSRTVERDPRLSWDILIDVYGDEDRLRLRLGCLEGSSLLTGADMDLLKLATKYLSGWRPTLFDNAQG